MLTTRKMLTHAALVAALALHGLTACSSDGENEEGVSEEVASDGQASGEEAAEADGGSPQASSDVLKSEEAEKVDDDATEAAPAPVVDEKASHAAPAPAPSAASAPASGRAVFFVKSDGAVLRDQPSASGKEVGSLRKGDSVVAEVEGDWAKTSGAKYISVKDLSNKPVGRSRSQRDWGDGAPAAPAKARKKSH